MTTSSIKKVLYCLTVFTSIFLWPIANYGQTIDLIAPSNVSSYNTHVKMSDSGKIEIRNDAGEMIVDAFSPQGSQVITIQGSRIDDVLSFDFSSGIDMAECNFHFVGNAGIDAISLHVDGDVTYASDDSGIANSGTITAVSNNGNTLKITFEDIEPVSLTGGGGSLLVDATSNPLVTQLIIDDDINYPGALPPLPMPTGISNGFSVIYEPNPAALFESLQFGGFSFVSVRSGTGSQTINLFGLDDSDALLTDIILDGDDTFNSDLSDDVLIVQSLPPTVRATLLGGGDGPFGDVFELNNTSASQLINISNQVFVQPSAGSPSPVFNSPEEGGPGHLILFDIGDNTGKDISIDASTIEGITGEGTAAPDITFEGMVTLDVFLGTGPDVVAVESLPTTEITIDGNDPTMVPGDVLNYANLSDFDDDGKIISVVGSEDINYINFEEVNYLFFIPTLGEWGIIVLGLCFLTIGIVYLRKNKTVNLSR